MGGALAARGRAGGGANVPLPLLHETSQSVPVSVTSPLDRFLRYPPLINFNRPINSLKSAHVPGVSVRVCVCV